MAFKSVSEKVSFKKLTSLNEGESITGYVTAITDSTKIEGQKNISMSIDGETVLVSPAGNVRYLLQDGKVRVGLNTRITRIADKNVKGKKSSQFTVEQDASDTFSDSQTLASFGTVNTSVNTSSSKASKIESLKSAKN